MNSIKNNPKFSINLRYHEHFEQIKKMFAKERKKNKQITHLIKDGNVDELKKVIDENENQGGVIDINVPIKIRSVKSISILGFAMNFPNRGFVGTNKFEAMVFSMFGWIINIEFMLLLISIISFVM